MAFTSISPLTGKSLASYEEMPSSDVTKAIERADEASRKWRLRSFSERAAFMRAAGCILREGAEEYGRLMAEEMGKPIKQGVAEAQKCATVCDYFAENAANFLAPEVVNAGFLKSFVTSSRSAWSSPSCPGISLSGRCSASPHQR